MLPSPSSIAGFLEIAETLNITKAAQRLGVTQPTLSQSLIKLEENLGVPLVIRGKSGVELTVAGKEFLKQAKRLMENWELVRSETQRSSREVRGNVKIGCHPSVGLYTLGNFLPSVLEDYPGVEITLVHDLSRKVLDKVINYEVDLGLVVNPARHLDLVMTKLLDDEVKIWKARGTIPDVLLVHPELVQTQEILRKLKRAGERPKRIVTTNSLELITELTIQGAGYGIIPSRVVQTMDRTKELRALPQSPIFKDELYVVHRVENRDIESIKVLRQRMIEAF